MLATYDGPFIVVTTETYGYEPFSPARETNAHVNAQHHGACHIELFKHLNPIQYARSAQPEQGPAASRPLPRAVER